MKYNNKTKKIILGLSTFSLSLVPILGCIPIDVSYKNDSTLNLNTSSYSSINYDDLITKEILKKIIKGNNYIEGSQSASIIHAEQSLHNKPNEVKQRPTGTMSFKYNPYIINATKPHNLGDLFAILNSNQTNTLRYDISGYELSVDRKYIGNVIFVPMYANKISFTRRPVSFQDKPSIMVPDNEKQMLSNPINVEKNGFANLFKYKSDNMYFIGQNQDPFVDVDTRRSCGSATCSHNIIDWVQITCGIVLGGVIGLGASLITNIGPIYESIVTGNIGGVIIPLITGFVGGAITGVSMAVGGLQGDASGECATLCSIINVYNNQNIYNDRKEKNIGIINSFDFGKIFDFKNVNSFYNSSDNPVWKKQNLKLGFNDDVMLSIKYLSDYANLYNEIQINKDKLLSTTSGKYSLIENEVNELIFGRKSSPERIANLIESFVKYTKYNNENEIVTIINKECNQEELPIFNTYRECGATIPNDIKDWGFVYDVALPQYLSHDILCDIEYNGSKAQAVKLWDHKTGFQNIDFESRNNSNISNIKMSNMRFSNLDKSTYTGLSIENYFDDQDNIIKGYGIVSYYLAYRADARNVASIDLNKDEEFIELPLNKFLISKKDPIKNGVINNNTNEMNNKNEVKDLLNKGCITSDSKPLFNNIYELNKGREFSNWEQAKDEFFINGNSINNDLKEQTNSDVYYEPNNTKGYFYAILEIDNFNFNDKLDWVSGDFTTKVRNLLLSSNSLVPLEKSNSIDQYFLARLKTNKISKVMNSKIINQDEIISSYKDPTNWEKSSLLFSETGEPVYIWDKTKKINVEFDSIRVECENRQEAIEMLYDSNYNKLNDYSIVSREIVGYDIDDEDEIDYSSPIYEYELNAKYTFNFDNEFNQYVLSEVSPLRTYNNKISIQTSLDNFNDFLNNENEYQGKYQLQTSWVKKDAISGNGKEIENGVINMNSNNSFNSSSKDKSLVLEILGGTLGTLAIITPFIVFITIRKHKKNLNTKENDNTSTSK